jgi:hypothetical protein
MNIVTALSVPFAGTDDSGQIERAFVPTRWRF